MTIDIIALITPKPGKAARVEELLTQAAVSVKANEPGTLRYHLHKEVKGDAPTFVMLETYKDKVAIDVHAKSEGFRAMGKVMKEEGLLDGPMRVMVTREAGGYASKL
ncbi:hypothetical protein CC86DRAFT_378584 [Ophiobolus disseminans]|uniref:ABM domain-containing protein n=1 Tax=Ophiobolus disseminans TaxID=1469910 RepID=A0A6A7AFY5_9PLEO|nr:hypothetical protein CC86DRAFT_378584 [Ophiobolus disseminans]